MSDDSADALPQDPDLLEINEGGNSKEEDAEAADSDKEEDEDEELEEDFDD